MGILGGLGDWFEEASAIPNVSKGQYFSAYMSHAAQVMSALDWGQPIPKNTMQGDLSAQSMNSTNQQLLQMKLKTAQAQQEHFSQGAARFAGGQSAAAGAATPDPYAPMNIDPSQGATGVPMGGMGASQAPMPTPPVSPAQQQGLKLEHQKSILQPVTPAQIQAPAQQAQAPAPAQNQNAPSARPNSGYVGPDGLPLTNSQLRFVFSGSQTGFQKRLSTVHRNISDQMEVSDDEKWVLDMFPGNTAEDKQMRRDARIFTKLPKGDRKDKYAKRLGFDDEREAVEFFSDMRGDTIPAATDPATDPATAPAQPALPPATPVSPTQQEPVPMVQQGQPQNATVVGPGGAPAVAPGQQPVPPAGQAIMPADAEEEASPYLQDETPAIAKAGKIDRNALREAGFSKSDIELLSKTATPTELEDMRRVENAQATMSPDEFKAWAVQDTADKSARREANRNKPTLQNRTVVVPEGQVGVPLNESVPLTPTGSGLPAYWVPVNDKSIYGKFIGDPAKDHHVVFNQKRFQETGEKEFAHVFDPGSAADPRRMSGAALNDRNEARQNVREVLRIFAMMRRHARKSGYEQWEASTNWQVWDSLKAGAALRLAKLNNLGVLQTNDRILVERRLGDIGIPHLGALFNWNPTDTQMQQGTPGRWLGRIAKAARDTGANIIEGDIYGEREGAANSAADDVDRILDDHTDTLLDAYKQKGGQLKDLDKRLIPERLWKYQFGGNQ